MGTTLNLDDDVLHMVRSYAGSAVSELVRKRLRMPVRTRTVNGIQVVDVPRRFATYHKPPGQGTRV